MLYIVATPIGNLEEITLRALDVLKSADLIAAEDTRHTALLLSKYDIRTPMRAYHKFNERETAGSIVAELKSGKTVALVSDAGMPCVSDPGHILLEEVIKAGEQYTVVSGACAAVNAVLLSGFSTRTFTMLGFLPEKNADRLRFIESYKNVPSTLIFYSAVHDIKKDLRFLYEALGARRVAVCREMTKMFECVTRFTLGEQADIVEKGEFVIVVEGSDGTSELNKLSVAEHIKRYLDDGLPVKDAVKKVASERKVAKSEVYKISLELKNDI